MRVFAHRGYSNKYVKENSITSLINAFNHGFSGVEIDIWYLQSQLVLTHDYPQDLSNLDRLEDFFTVFGNKILYWLDFKNLTPANTTQAMNQLKAIILKLNINYDNLYFVPFIPNIEEAKPIYENIRKVLGGVKIMALLESLAISDYNSYYQQLKKSNIDNLSIEFHNLTPEFIQHFRDINIFAWTVNFQEELLPLQKIGVANIASDMLTPVFLEKLSIS